MATGTIEVDKNMLLFPNERIPASSDLNDLTGKPGTYYVISDGDAATISNMPRTASGTLIHLNRALGAYQTQFYFPTTAYSIVYVRSYSGGVWSNWEVLTQMLMLSSTGGYTSATAKQAIKDAYTSLPVGSVRFGQLDAGDFSMLLIMKANNNYGVVVLFSYGSSKDAKVSIRSMTLFGGTWGDWVAIT